jgi:hypothetical protein
VEDVQFALNSLPSHTVAVAFSTSDFTALSELLSSAKIIIDFSGVENFYYDMLLKSSKNIVINVFDGMLQVTEALSSNATETATSPVVIEANQNVKATTKTSRFVSVACSQTFNATTNFIAIYISWFLISLNPTLEEVCAIEVKSSQQVSIENIVLQEEVTSIGAKDTNNFMTDFVIVDESLCLLTANSAQTFQIIFLTVEGSAVVSKIKDSKNTIVEIFIVDSSENLYKLKLSNRRNIEGNFHLYVLTSPKLKQSIPNEITILSGFLSVGNMKAAGMSPLSYHDNKSISYLDVYALWELKIEV